MDGVPVEGNGFAESWRFGKHDLDGNAAHFCSGSTCCSG
jgi:hypothetical protein